MARQTIPMTIAGISTFIHVCMTFFLTYGLIQLIVIISEPYEGHKEGDSDLALVGGIFITVLIISLLMEVAVLVVSVYLILGIQRERHQFIAPWIYLTGVYMILSFMGMIRGPNAFDTSFAVNVIIIIFHAAMWYPIFKYWRDLRTGRNSNIPLNSPLNVCFTTQTPGTVYNVGPQNWQPDQSDANFYPPPGYGPQMQTGAGSYPQQKYVAGQMQPSIYPQLGSDSYARQMTPTAVEAVR